MRIVLDTNILIGALITKGTPPGQAVPGVAARRDRAGNVHARNSPRSPPFSPDPACEGISTPTQRRPFVENIDARALVLDAPPDVDLSSDPKDNPILAAAIAGKADLIVSGDKRHMLALGAGRRHPYRHGP